MTFWARIRRTPSWWIPIVLVVIVSVAIVVQVSVGGSEEPGPSATASPAPTETEGHSYQSGPESFVEQLRAGRVDSVVIDDIAETIDVTTKGPVVERYRVSYPDLGELITLLAERSGVVVRIVESPFWLGLLLFLVPMALVAVAGGTVGYLLGRRRGRREAIAATGATE